ncbi:MAG: hypothetical protein ABR577_18245 [Pyrinomonadaceae bacterium]
MYNVMGELPEQARMPMVNEVFDVTPGLQCCVRCGRVLTDRALHDSIEERVLDSIRADHSEWIQADGACQPCLSEYRRLLVNRQTRAEQLREEEAKTMRLPTWVGKIFGRSERNSRSMPVS